jgi:hypothetical protein
LWGGGGGGGWTGPRAFAFAPGCVCSDCQHDGYCGRGSECACECQSGGVVDDGAVPSMVAVTDAGAGAGIGTGIEAGLRGRGSITITFHAVALFYVVLFCFVCFVLCVVCCL